MNLNIDVITVCYNSSHFINHLMQSLDLKTKQDYRMVVVDNGSSAEHQDVLLNMERQRNAYVIRRSQAPVRPTYSASRHHGEALQCAIENIPEDHIGVVIDCDSYMIKNHWDVDIMSLLGDYEHISCQRPGVKFGCGAWFSAFRLKTVIENEISFLPILKPNGEDCPRPNLYDVGSDMIRIDPWKPIFRHPKIKYNGNSHVWTLDDDFFVDHMGGCRNTHEFDQWRAWLKEKWG